MTKILTGALAAAAVVAVAGAAQAAEQNVCVWTGHDWACGDGNVFTSHVSASAALPMPVTSVPTVPSNEAPLLSGPRPQQ
jgi:hypothetical protein